MPIGTVKWYSVDKGYGFVVPDDGSDDVFVHVTAVEDAGLELLLTNQQINFETAMNDRNGRPKAVNLRLP